jgi:hypothetical protein
LTPPHLGNPYIGLQQATDERGTHVQKLMDNRLLEGVKNKYIGNSPKISIKKVSR